MKAGSNNRALQISQMKKGEKSFNVIFILPFLSGELGIKDVNRLVIDRPVNQTFTG